MKHLSWKYRRRRTPQEQREFRAAQAKRVARRWEKRREALKDAPVRVSRVTELRVVDSHRPMMVIRLQREESARGWGRAEVWESGRRVGKGRFGVAAIGRLIAGVLR